MSEKMKLIHVAAKADESLHGFLLRVSEANVYNRAQWIVDLIGADITQAGGKVSLLKHLDELASLLGVSPARLQEMGYHRFKGKAAEIKSFGKQKFHRTQIDLRRAVVCPECLKESPHLRKVWDLTLATACLKHGVKLIDTCSHCKPSPRPISWARSGVTHCECGADFRQIEAQPATADELVAAQALYSSAGKGNFRVTNAMVNEASKKWGINDFAMVAAFIGWVAGYMPKPDYRRFVSLSPDVRSKVMSEVGRVLSDWPARWHHLLAEKTNAKPTTFGYHQLFKGALYARLFDRSKDASLHLLQQGFFSFIAGDDQVSVLTNRGNPRAANINVEKHVSAQRACTKLGVSKETFKWLSDTGKLAVASIKSGKQTLHRVRLSDLEKARAYLDSIVGTKELAEQLGISVPLAEQMLMAGIIGAERGLVVDEYRNWKIARPTIDAFIRDVEVRAAAISQNANDLISVKAAITWLRSQGVHAISIIVALAAGDVSPVLPNQKFETLGLVKISRSELFDALGIKAAS